MPKATGRTLAARGAQDARTMDRLTNAFATELQQVMRLLGGQARRLADRLRTSVRGRLVADRANLARVVRLRADLAAALDRSGYARLVTAVMDAPLDRLAARVLQGDRLAGLAAQMTPVDIDALAALKTADVRKLLGVGAEAVETTWRVLLDGVLGARPLSDLVDDLAGVLDLSVRQARTVYDTAVSTYPRAVAALNATGADDELWLYVGPVDSVTREFCLAHVGKVYTRAEIDELDNETKSLPDPFLNCGGWNCRHRWQRVSGLDDEMRALVGTNERAGWVQEQLDALDTEAA